MNPNLPPLLKDKKIALGVCGSIAIYKSIEILRNLQKLGAKVRIVMSDKSQDFIRPLLFETLSNYEVLCSQTQKWSQSPNNHIEIASWADLFLIAPCTANSINKIAYGIADNILLESFLAFDKTKLITPAANTKMLENYATLESLEILKQRGISIINPQSKELACKQIGNGALAEPLEKYSFGFSSVNSRYNEGGERKPYVFPIKYDKTSPNRALLYIGKAEEDFIFDFNMFTETYENAGVALLRPITEAERNLINFVNPSNGTVTINFTSEDYFIPIIFQGDNLSDGYIKLISPSNHKLRFTCGHKNHIGYTSISLDNGEIITPIEYSNEILECAYIINDRKKEGSITLQFSKDGSFPPLYPIIESDSPTILKSNERYSILPNQKELVLEIDLGDNDFDNYDFRTNAIDSQYTDGTRRHYMFPLNYDENTNTVVLYIGTVDKEFSFPVEMHAETDNAGTATLREITEKEKEKILYINPAERRIEIYISKENLYTPIIFKGEESLLRNGYIKIEISSIDPWLQIVSGHTDRYGYSQRSIDMDENIIDRTDRPQDILEYANLYNPNGYEGNMILSFSRDGNF